MENHILFMGKSTISMAMFNSYIKLPEGNDISVTRTSVQYFCFEQFLPKFDEQNVLRGKSPAI